MPTKKGGKSAMTFSCITPEEARAKYKAAEDKDYIVGVIADLTVATKKEVREFLGVSNLPVKKRRKPGVFDPVQVRRLYDKGYSDTEIGAVFGVARQTIGQWRRRNGLPAHYPPQKADDNRMEFYRQGLSDTAIAIAVGVSQTAIWRWRQNRHLPPNETRGGNRRQKKGAMCGHADNHD